MTLIITGILALITIAIRFGSPVFAGKWHIGALALMYSAASIMWVVDGIFCLMDNEAFIELKNSAVMADDALLGLCVAVLGLVIWAVICVYKHHTTSTVSSN
jgi:hypothetical protein